MASFDCLACSLFQEKTASLYADYVAAKDEAAITKKSDMRYKEKLNEVVRTKGLLHEAYKESNAHYQEAHRG